MSCSECVNISCRDLYISPCDTGINTLVSVAVTGTYTVRISFNGAIQQMELELTVNENIILANILNGSYVHTMTIYDSDGNLVNDTCYRLNTHVISGPANNLTPTPAAGASKIIIVDVDGSTFTNAFFAVHTILAISTDSQTYLKDVGFTQSGSTITAIQFSFYNGQTIFAQA